MSYRVEAVKKNIAERERLNRIEKAKLGVLRAERAKTSENCHWLSSRAIDIDHKMNTVRPY